MCDDEIKEHYYKYVNCKKDKNALCNYEKYLWKIKSADKLTSINYKYLNCQIDEINNKTDVCYGPLLKSIIDMHICYTNILLNKNE